MDENWLMARVVFTAGSTINYATYFFWYQQGTHLCTALLPLKHGKSL